MTNPQKILLSFFAFLLAATAQAASLYKWTDEQGNTHFSQTPPQKTKAERMKIDPLPASSNREAAKSTGGAAENNNAEQLSDEKKPLDTVDKQLAKNCEIAKSNLANYQKYSKVRNASGEVITLDEETRQAKISEAQRMIEQYCR